MSFSKYTISHNMVIILTNGVVNMKIYSIVFNPLVNYNNHNIKEVLGTWAWLHHNKGYKLGYF